MNDPVDTLISKWQNQIGDSHPFGLSSGQLVELAEVALIALECGETHPDRASVRCTQLPHGNGHLYHRNSELGLEWWTNDGTTQTVHDALGPIQLGQPLAAAEPQEAASRCPECQWLGQDGRNHDQLIGGWLRCAHCGHEWNRSESRPSTWCRAKHPHFDMYCDLPAPPADHSQHGSCIYGVQWTDPHGPAESDTRGRYHTLPPCEDDDASCGAKHPKWDWYCDREPHEVTTEDHSTWHHDNTRDRYWPQWQETEDDSGVDTTAAEADLAIYRDLIPLLGPVATYLDQISKRYRDGNPRTTADQCRSAEGYRDQLAEVVDMLRGMIGEGTDDAA